MGQSLFYLWCFFVHFATTNGKSGCDAPSVYKNQSASITCHFDIDVSEMEKDVAVLKINKSGHHKVLKCIWIAKQRHCTPSPGYYVDGNVTQELVLGIPSATPEYVGTYVCQIIPADPQNLTACNFTLKDPAAGEDSEENGIWGTVKIVGIVVGSILGVGLIVCAIALVYKCRNNQFGERTQNTDGDQTREEQMELNPKAKRLASIRVVMIGSSGTGKSSLGNTILGGDFFKCGPSFSSETKLCDFHVATRGKCEYQVVDTPGLCDTHRTEEEVCREVAKSVALASPGPHIILMVLRCDKRFTKEERQAYDTLKRMFTVEMCKHMIVIFNGLDTFSDLLGHRVTKENLPIIRTALHEELTRSPPPYNLSEILEEAGGGYFGITNEAPRKVLEMQFKELTERMMEVARKNDNNYYSSERFDAINQRIDKMVEERIQQSPGKTKEKAEKEVKEGINEDRTWGLEFISEFTGCTIS